MDLTQMMQQRSHLLETFAQVSANVEDLTRKRKMARNQAAAILEELRMLTAQINAVQAQAQQAVVAPNGQSSAAQTAGV